MAAEERGSLTIEDEVAIKCNNNNNKKETSKWGCCNPIYVLIIFLLFLLILAIAGVLLYFLPKRSCYTNNTTKPTLPPRKTTRPVTLFQAESEFPTYSNDLDSVDWSSQVIIKEPEVQGPWQGRLPRSVIPLRYNLTITPYFYPEDIKNDQQLFTFDGKVSIAVECKAPTSQIILHMSSMNITQVSVRSGQTNGGNLVFSVDEEDFMFDFLKIHLNQELNIDAVYIIDIVYVGILQDEPMGFYKIDFTDESGQKRWGGVTTMQPTAARKATPCFDEPEYKAEFDVTIRHRSDMTALSNGIELGTTDFDKPRNDGLRWKETAFKTTPKMSTYLLAFTVNHFVSLSKTTDSGVLVRVWSKPQDINYTKYALESAVKHTSFFESYYELDYPLEKQDMVAVPFFLAMAMENWGLIVYQESAMIYDPDSHSQYQKELVAKIVAHEIAHQWFGNLVTPMWWDDLWLNEGFARYTEFIGVEHSEPEWNMMATFLENTFKFAMYRDSSSDTHPVRENVNTPDEIFSIFDDITYNKGATVIRMLINMLGEEVFHQGLRNYLKRHAYNNTITEDLWASLTEADITHGGIDVKTVMETWTLQPFYPIVTFTRISDNTVAISQNVFFKDGSAKMKYDEIVPQYGNLTWEILVSHTHQSEHNVESPNKYWLHGEHSGEMTLSSGAQPTDWFLANIGCYGYYRINYDSTNWDRLIQQLIRDHTIIPVENRFQLLDDATTLMKSDDLDINTLLNLTLYLDQELEYIPWSAATYLVDTILLPLCRMQPYYGILQDFWLQRMSKVYEHLGGPSAMTRIPENPTLLKHRFQLTQAACFFRDEGCIQKARELYAAYMEDPTNNPVQESSELQRFVYCYAIMLGGEREWFFGFQRFLSLSDSARGADKHWLYGLSCSRQPWILNKLLSDAYYGKLKKYKAFNYVVGHMTGHEIGLSVAWNYLQLHWEEMWNDYDNDVTFHYLFEEVGRHMYSELHLSQLEEFAKVHDLVAGSYIEKYYTNAVEKVRNTVMLRQKYSKEAFFWLEEWVPF